MTPLCVNHITAALRAVGMGHAVMDRITAVLRIRAVDMGHAVMDRIRLRAVSICIGHVDRITEEKDTGGKKKRAVTAHVLTARGVL
jgi:hypothetical protein